VAGRLEVWRLDRALAEAAERVALSTVPGTIASVAVAAIDAVQSSGKNQCQREIQDEP
jgi:hypothetical protein